MYAKVLSAVLLIILISVPANLAAAGPAGRTDSNPDGTAYQLEMSGHEALTALKNSPLSQLNDFVSDGCSGGLSVGWQYLAERIETYKQVLGKQPPWEACCISHDRAYHAAGGRDVSAAESFELRRSADQLLRMCVQKTGAERSSELSSAYGIAGEEVERPSGVISSLMYRAVRIGGLPCTGLPWRWGYGWPECEK